MSLQWYLASPAKTATSDDSASPSKSTSESGKQVTVSSYSKESLPLLSSPVLDPKAVSKASNVHSLCVNNADEFEFDSPLKAFSKTENKQDIEFGNMFELQSKRKASLSPESKDLTRKEKKAQYKY